MVEDVTSTDPSLRFRVSDCLLFFGFVEDVGEMATAAVLAIEVSRHKDAGAAVLVGTLTSQTSDLSILVDLVIFED